jgi:hypothetical protein
LESRTLADGRCQVEKIGHAAVADVSELARSGDGVDVPCARVEPRDLRRSVGSSCGRLDSGISEFTGSAAFAVRLVPVGDGVPSGAVELLDVEDWSRRHRGR